MMNYKNFWKMILSLGLLVTLILPSAGLANAKTNAPMIPSRLFGDKSDALVKYGQLVAKYFADCNDLDKQERPSGEKLKRCLMIAKELRDRFTEFTSTLETLVKNIKNAKKWTKELDEQFNKEAAKFKIDAETIDNIRQAGGVRAFYQENLNVLKAFKGDLDIEVKNLETKIQKNASTQNQFFQTVSYAPAAEHAEYKRAGLNRILNKVAKAAVDVAIAFCVATQVCPD